jgi:hypothetical protein
VVLHSSNSPQQGENQVVTKTGITPRDAPNKKKTVRTAVASEALTKFCTATRKRGNAALLFPSSFLFPVSLFVSVVCSRYHHSFVVVFSFSFFYWKAA